MKFLNSTLCSALVLLFSLNMSILSQTAHACACGCGIFDVGTSAMLPSESGTMLFAEYDFMNQNQNRHATSVSNAANNLDKVIKTQYLTLGAQTMFTRSLGIQIDLPLVKRHFETVDPDTSTLGSFDHTALGDIRVKGIYTGFSADMSTGVMFGFKLPTGSTDAPGFDYDTQIGTGSTDLLLGIYHFSALSDDKLWNSIFQVNLNQPLLTQHDYIPGNEVDLAYGVFHSGLKWFPEFALVPMLQLRAALKASDHGSNGHSDDTGSERLLMAPGLEISYRNWRLYSDISLPLYQFMNGNQLVSNGLFKLIVSYLF